MEFYYLLLHNIECKTIFIATLFSHILRKSPINQMIKFIEFSNFHALEVRLNHLGLDQSINFLFHSVKSTINRKSDTCKPFKPFSSTHVTLALFEKEKTSVWQLLNYGYKLHSRKFINNKSNIKQQELGTIQLPLTTARQILHHLHSTRFCIAKQNFYCWQYVECCCF